ASSRDQLSWHEPTQMTGSRPRSVVRAGEQPAAASVDAGVRVMSVDLTMKTLIGIAALGLWSLLIAGIVRPRDAGQLQRIESRLTELNSTLSGIESDLSDLEEDFSDLEADVSDLESDLSDLR